MPKTNELKKFNIYVACEVGRNVVIAAHDEREATHLLYDAIDNGKIKICYPKSDGITVTGYDRIYGAEDNTSDEMPELIAPQENDE